VARNRKRAKERRSRRPAPAATPARGNRAAPDPIAHATPDAELAEAQLASGRPDPSAEPLSDEELEAAEIADEHAEDLEPAGRSSPIPGYIPERPGVEQAPAGEELTGEELAEVQRPEHPAPRASTVNRLINFLQGSWRELQRVQWPDRRQVMQATGVVIGFVIVAGAYLGAADALASKIVDFILK
jgi:preprotein translocase SecE subunit